MAKAETTIYPEFHLRIPNDNLTAWMFINNAFTEKRLDSSGIPWNPAQHYWNGVLFQLGSYERLVGAGPIAILDKIVIHRPAPHDDVEVTRAEFEAATEPIWINIVGGQTVRVNPMESDDLPLPFFNPPRSLHNFLTPYPGGITLWQHFDQQQVRVRAQQSGFRNQFDFGLKPVEGFRVEVWRSSMVMEGPFTDVELVEVKVSTNGGSDGDRKNPPQRP